MRKAMHLKHLEILNKMHLPLGSQTLKEHFKAAQPPITSAAIFLKAFTNNYIKGLRWEKTDKKSNSTIWFPCS